MAENIGYEDEDDLHEPAPTIIEQPKATTRTGDTTSIQIEDDDDWLETAGKSEYSGCYDRVCDVFGNRQSAYIDALRPLRIKLIKTQEILIVFQLERERELKTKHVKQTAEAVRIALRDINRLITHNLLNIQPAESEMLRDVCYDLVVLWRVLHEMEVTQSEGKKLRSNSKYSGDAPADSVHHNVTRRNSEGHEFADANVGVSAVDEHSLKERIDRTSETLEKLIKYIDTKTQRRWWLKDLINFFQLAIKLALFISAVISVVYHMNQTFPIVTLVIAISQGIVEILDQFFIKHMQPDQIKLSAITVLATNKAGGKLAI